MLEKLELIYVGSLGISEMWVFAVFTSLKRTRISCHTTIFWIKDGAEKKSKILNNQIIILEIWIDNHVCNFSAGFFYWKMKFCWKNLYVDLHDFSCPDFDYDFRLMNYFNWEIEQWIINIKIYSRMNISKKNPPTNSFRIPSQTNRPELQYGTRSQV